MHAAPAELPQKRGRCVLAVGAHPDDIELGCAGALLRYHDEGYETHALVLSGGEKGIESPRGKTRVRAQEAERGAKMMRLDTLTVLSFPDSQLALRRREIMSAIESAVVRCAPEIVLTHNRFDLHDDHRLVFDATVEASRCVPTVLCYENPNTPPEFRPNFYVDVAAYVEDKIRALECHASQMNKAYFHPELVRSMARLRGHQGRAQFAEAFEAVRVRWG